MNQQFQDDIHQISFDKEIMQGKIIQEKLKSVQMVYKSMEDKERIHGYWFIHRVDLCLMDGWKIDLFGFYADTGQYYSSQFIYLI